MSEVRIFSEIEPIIAFPEFNFYELYYSTFEKTELGRIKKLLPLCEMADSFRLKTLNGNPYGNLRYYDVFFFRIVSEIVIVLLFASAIKGG